MKQRLISAGVGVAVALVVFFFSELIVLEIAAILLSMIGIYEIFNTAGLKDRTVLMTVAWICSALAILTARDVILISPSAAVVTFFIAVLFSVVSNFGNGSSETVLTVAVWSAYISMGMFSLVYIRCFPHGLFFLIMTLGSAWITDAGAYFAGRFFGKHKLAPTLSPKKTIEGAIGGVLTTVILGIVAAYFYASYFGDGGKVNYLFLGIVLAITAVISMYGDLFASAFKRHYNVKDFGNFMPGHGGFIDRFDSVLAVAPLFAFALSQVTLLG